MNPNQNICKNCSYFYQFKAFPGAHGECERVDEVASDRATLDVRVDDDSGLTARLLVGPEFGCVQFKPKGTT